MGLFDGTALERPVMCERCGQDMKTCPCDPNAEPELAPEKHKLNLRVEKRKKGKVATVVSGFVSSPILMDTTLVRLKNALGTGGTRQLDSLELQGDQAARVESELLKLGFKVSKSR